MNNTEMMQLLDESIKRVVLPELKEIRVELSKITAVLDELRRFLFQQYEKREIEFFATKRALDRIEQRLDAIEESKKERKTLKGEVESRAKRAGQAKKKSRVL